MTKDTDHLIKMLEDAIETLFEDNSYDEMHGLIDLDWDSKPEGLTVTENGRTYRIVLEEIHEPGSMTTPPTPEMLERGIGSLNPEPTGSPASLECTLRDGDQKVISTLTHQVEDEGPEEDRRFTETLNDVALAMYLKA